MINNKTDAWKTDVNLIDKAQIAQKFPKKLPKSPESQSCAASMKPSKHKT